MKKMITMVLAVAIFLFSCQKAENQAILLLKFDADCTTYTEQFIEDYEFKDVDGLSIRDQGKIVDEETVLRNDVLSSDSAGSTATIELRFEDRERYDELVQEYDRLPEIYDLKFEINRNENHLETPYEICYYPIYQKITINDDGKEIDFEIPVGVEQVISDLEN